MILTFAVPDADHDEFYALPQAVQDEIKIMLSALCRIHNAPGKQRVRQMQEESDRVGGRGKSWRNIRTKYYAYSHSGNWRILVNRAKAEGGREALNADFVQWFQGRCDNHKRTINSAIDELYSAWYAGDEIPGYGTWREWWAKEPAYATRPLPLDCPTDLPHGWTRGNLRKYQPHKTQTVLVRRGIAAAIATMPTCISTREGLRPFEYLVFDDAETDFLIAEPVSGQICKLEGLFCKDVATDVWLRFGLRPGIKRDDGSRESLKRQDMLELAVQILTTYGFPKDYTSTWIVERGTATISEPDAKAIYDATGGKVIISQTGMINGKVLCEGYADKAVGNFRAKPWIESGFNLLWNKLDHVRGQKGNRYQNAPMELETRTKAAVDILRAGKLLPAEVMLSEHLPFQDLRESFLSINDALKKINSRTEHRCEGFAKVMRWRFADFGIAEWQPYEKLLQLPAEVRNKVEIMQAMESPYERMARLQQEHNVVMETIHPGAIPRILTDYHRTVKVLDGEITLTVDGQLLRYFHPDSPICAQEGEAFTAYLPKGDFETIYLVAGEGPARRYIGSLPRRIGKKYGDLDARNKQLAGKRKVLARHVHAIRERHGEDIDKAIADTDQTLVLMQRLDGALLTSGPSVGGATGVAISDLSHDMATRRVAINKADADDRRRETLAEKAERALAGNAK
jgi:hypothetical protein